MREFYGKVINQIVDADLQWKEFPCECLAPDEHFLFNFDVFSGDKAWLILDPYGDDINPKEIVDRLFGDRTFEKGYALAIDRAEGMVYRATFMLDDDGLNKIVLCGFDKPIQLPEKYLRRIDELKTKKRPYFLTFHTHTLLSFIDREACFNDLRDDIIVDLHFNNARLQIGHDSFREVTGWENL